MTRRLSLAEIWAEIPPVPCKGLCYQSCGPIPLGAAELAAVTAARGGVEPSSLRGGKGAAGLMVDPVSMACPNLNMANRCSVYKARPTICRLFGAVDAPLLRCPHGCEPDHYMTEAQSREMLALSLRAEK